MYPLYTRLGGPQGRSGRVRKISPPPGFDPRTVQSVANRYGVLYYNNNSNNNCDISNNRGNWNHLKIIQKIHEQRNGKAQNQGTTENSHIGHDTHTSESTDVKVQDIYHAICYVYRIL